MLMYGSTIEADMVHHIFPVEEYPQYAYCDWNLISVNTHTHRQMLHERYGKLARLGKNLMYAKAAERGINLKMKVMVCGFPGSGKSTLCKKLITQNGGLCYELDAIASAFRLTVPHAEKPHPIARKMAAALRQAWINEAVKQCSYVVVNRTIPDEDELEDFMPDLIYICRKVYTDRGYEYDKKAYRKRLDEIEQWASLRGVPVEHIPPVIEQTNTRSE